MSDEILYLTWWAFASESVRSKPLIHLGRTRSEMEIHHLSDKEKDTWGYMMIRGLWGPQSDNIIDVQLGDADADS